MEIDFGLRIDKTGKFKHDMWCACSHILDDSLQLYFYLYAQLLYD